MALYLYEEFLRDLRNEGDSKFAGRVLSKLLDAQSRFVIDRDDHRYHGIDGAWIRYVSMGQSGIRAIFIRRGDDVYLYRAGPHSVEDRLSPPSAGALVIPVVGVSGELRSALAAIDEGAQERAPRRFLENFRAELIRTKVLGRRFVKHRSVTLISPFLNYELFSISSPLWKVLEDLRSEGAVVSLVTRPPKTNEDLRFFERLESMGFSILFHDTLHSKLYMFEVDPTVSERELRGLEPNLALIGSANLTSKGFGINPTGTDVPKANEEILFELPAEQFAVANEYACYLAISANDIPRQRVILTRQQRRGALEARGEQ